VDYAKEVIAAFGHNNEDLQQTSGQDIKKALLRHITENPGIWYRELLRLSGISNGALTHHLRGLEEASKIRVQRSDYLGKTRYYALDVSDAESNIISFLRNDTAKQIVLQMLENEFCTFAEVVEKTGRSPSTVSWHLKRLSAAGLITVRKSADYVLYCLSNRIAVSDVLAKYRSSFLEAVANSYSEIIDEL
jgi:predicted transcriptional regulator